MAQPSKIKANTKDSKKVARKVNSKTTRHHPKYGTSKLEDRFAKDFLDKLGIKYIRQFEAKDIGRFYDFYCPDANVILEIDGDFFHGYGLVHEEKSPMQKRNERVDRLKDEWALSHGIPIIRIWEHDINDHPQKVLLLLEDRIGNYTEKKIRKDNKNKRH